MPMEFELFRSDIGAKNKAVDVDKVRERRLTSNHASFSRPDIQCFIGSCELKSYG